MTHESQARLMWPATSVVSKVSGEIGGGLDGVDSRWLPGIRLVSNLVTSPRER